MATISPEARQLAELQARGSSQGGPRASHEEIIEACIAEHQPSPEGAEAFRGWFRTWRTEVKPKDRAILDRGTRLDLRLQERAFAAWSWGEGPVVLLLHGIHGNSGQLTRFVDPLVDAGLRVVAFDAPAHGDNPGNSTDIFEFYELYLAVVQAVGEAYAVLSHSFGNTWALYSLARGSAAQRVVCLAPPAEQSYLFQTWRTIHSLGDQAAEEFIAMHHARFGPFEDYDNKGFARRIAARALIFHDREDPIIPYEVGGERLAAAWPGAEFVATEGLGHYRILKDEAVLRRVVAFLGA